MNFGPFWDMAIALMMEILRTYETSVYIYEATRRLTQMAIVFILASVKPELSLQKGYRPPPRISYVL
jgi:hypothetical protein